MVGKLTSQDQGRVARDPLRVGAGAHVHAASRSRLFHKELTATDPEFCERFEILRVTAGNRVFLPTFNTETTLSRRVRLDLYHERGIHERRSMDPNESVWLPWR